MGRVDVNITRRVKRGPRESEVQDNVHGQTARMRHDYPEAESYLVKQAYPDNTADVHKPHWPEGVYRRKVRIESVNGFKELPVGIGIVVKHTSVNRQRPRIHRIAPFFARWGPSAFEELPIDGWSTWAHGPLRQNNLEDQFNFPSPLRDFVLGGPYEAGEVMGMVCEGVENNPAMIVFFYKDEAPYLTIKSINPVTLVENWSIEENQRDARAADIIPYKPHIIGNFFYHHQQWDSEYLAGFPQSKFVCRSMANGAVVWRYRLYDGSGLPGSFHLHKNQLGFPLEFGSWLVLAQIIVWDREDDSGQDWYFDVLVLDPTTAEAGIISAPKLFHRRFLSPFYDIFPKDFVGGPCILISDGEYIVAKMANGENNVFDRNQSIAICFRIRTLSNGNLEFELVWIKGGTTEIVPGDGTFGDGDVFDWERPLSIGHWDTTAISVGYLKTTDAWLPLLMADGRILAAQRHKGIAIRADRHTIDLGRMWDLGEIEDGLEHPSLFPGWVWSDASYSSGSSGFFSATGPSFVTARTFFRTDAKWVHPTSGPVRKLHKLALNTGEQVQTEELPSSLSSTNSEGREYVVRGGDSHSITQHALTSSQITMTAANGRLWRYGYHEPLEINLGPASSWVREPTSLEDYQQNLWLLSFQQLEDLSNETGNLPNTLLVMNSRRRLNSSTGTNQWDHVINRRLWLGVNPAIVYWVDGSTTEGGGPRWMVWDGANQCAILNGRFPFPDLYPSHLNDATGGADTPFIIIDYVPQVGDLYFLGSPTVPPSDLGTNVPASATLQHITPFGTYDTGLTFGISGSSEFFGGSQFDFGGHRVYIQGGDLILTVGNWFWATAEKAAPGFPAAFTTPITPSDYTITVAKCPGEAIPIQVENPDLIDDRGKIDRDIVAVLGDNGVTNLVTSYEHTPDSLNKLMGIRWSSLKEEWRLEAYDHYVGNSQKTEPRKLMYNGRLITIADKDSVTSLLELDPNNGTVITDKPLTGPPSASHIEKNHLLPAGGRIFLGVGESDPNHNVFEGFLGHTKLDGE